MGFAWPSHSQLEVDIRAQLGIFFLGVGGLEQGLEQLVYWSMFCSKKPSIYAQQFPDAATWLSVSSVKIICKMWEQ